MKYQELTFTFYNIYIKTWVLQIKTSRRADLHSTIFILKLINKSFKYNWIYIYILQYLY